MAPFREIVFILTISFWHLFSNGEVRLLKVCEYNRFDEDDVSGLKEGIIIKLYEILLFGNRLFRYRVIKIHTLCPFNGECSL
jgi:hypothetical protein